MSDFSEAREKRYVGLTRENNPYIPRFLNSNPWYATEESLSNISENALTAPLKKRKPAATKFRPGACTNCGAMGHKAKDCMERPRKKGAKFTGQDIQPDIEAVDTNMSYDSKRDRYNGYDVNEYQKVIEKFEAKQAKGDDRVNEEYKAKKDELLHKVGYLTGDSEKTGDLYGDEPTVSRRDRHDKAHYLDNFSTDGLSPLFHPKSAALRKTEGEINEQGQFVPKLDKEAEEHKRRLAEADRAKVQLELNPTASLLALTKKQQEEEALKKKLQSEVLEKYGGSQYMAERPVELATAPVEGARIPKDTDQAIGGSGKSIYPEDVYPGNHSSVWGSYYKDSKWGYSCCHSVIKQSYCLGERGKELNQ